MEVKEASYGVVWARGWVEEGAPRRPRRGAAMVAATAVPGQQGQRSSALALRKEGEKDGDVSELVG